MKRFLILFIFLFSVSGICSAASAKYDDIVAEYIVYREIEQKIEDALTKIEKIMIKIDSASESKNNKDIKANIKTVESQMKVVEKQIKAQIMKIYILTHLNFGKKNQNNMKKNMDILIME